MESRALALALASIVAAHSAPPVVAAVVESEERIDAPTSPGVDPQYPDVAVDDGGRRIYVWNSFDGADRHDVLVRIVSAEGATLVGPIQVNTLAADDQQQPRVAVAPDGSFLVVWQSDEYDDDVGTTRRWVRSQAFDTAGSPVGSEELLSTLSSATATDIHADVAALRTTDGTSGGYVVVWQSRNSPGTDTDDSIQGRLVSAYGVPIGGQYQVNSDDGTNQTHPAVTELTDGGFLVVWDGPELMGRRFTAGGAPVGADFQISTGYSGQKLDPDAAIGWDGRVAVAWGDAEGPDDAREIRMRLFAPDLNPLGPDFRVNTLLTLDQSSPRIADLGPDGFLVVWESQASVGDDASGDSVQARTVTGPDQFAGPQTQLNVYAEQGQQMPTAHGQYGRVATAWRSPGHPEDTNETNIRGRVVEACLFCDDFETGGTSRWTAAVP